MPERLSRTADFGGRESSRAPPVIAWRGRLPAPVNASPFSGQTRGAPKSTRPARQESRPPGRIAGGRESSRAPPVVAWRGRLPGPKNASSSEDTLVAKVDAPGSTGVSPSKANCNCAVCEVQLNPLYNSFSWRSDNEDEFAESDKQLPVDPLIRGDDACRPADPGRGDRRIRVVAGCGMEFSVRAN